MFTPEAIPKLAPTLEYLKLHQGQARLLKIEVQSRESPTTEAQHHDYLTSSSVLSMPVG